MSGKRRHIQQDYFEKLRDPRWQRKRLTILQRAEFCCEWCDASDKTLTVHHSFYEYGLEPWDYPDDSLHCLCEECHKYAQSLYTDIKRQLGRIGLAETEALLGYAVGLELGMWPMIKTKVTTYHFADGIAQSIGLTAEELISALGDGDTLTGMQLARLQKAKKRWLEELASGSDVKESNHGR